MPDLTEFKTHEETKMLDKVKLEEDQKRFAEMFAKGPQDAPWLKEPHREEFKHAGLDCLLQRGPWGAWCGYVAVKPGHPAYQKNYMDLENIDVHGGLTYGESCQGTICHVPAPGEPDSVYWLGFDCAHSCDIAPNDRISYPDRFGYAGREYRDINYVREETKRLAEQLAKMRTA